ncbi:MAG: hypothetical protein VX796_07870, partial [Pseudomonadota bacterium]|nr:hypothetical protein [Pseudomonadota bacterium]
RVQRLIFESLDILGIETIDPVDLTIHVAAPCLGTGASLLRHREPIPTAAVLFRRQLAFPAAMMGASTLPCDAAGFTRKPG